MRLSKLELSHFRNFDKKSFEFSDATSVIVGPNAAGKTNLLESVFLLAAGKSFKAKVEEEMVNYDAEVAHIGGQVIGEEKVKLEIVLTRGEIKIGEDPVKYEKVPKKRLSVNGTPKRLVDFVGNLRVVLFAPRDLDIVTESPSTRRKFLDTTLSLSDREYRRAVLSYEKGLRQRNRLLWQIRESGSIASARGRLLFWDKLLIKNGNYISTAREEFIDFVNQTGPVNNEVFRLEYDNSAISESRLAQYTNEEIAAATTLVGPHRDDFIFHMGPAGKDHNLSSFGSRGQQRMGVLWVKLAELTYVEKKSEEKPVLLLDDIFSELDHNHRDVVMSVVGKQQTIITTADPDFVKMFKNIDTIKIGK